MHFGNTQYLMTNLVPKLFIYALPGILIQEGSVAVINETFNPQDTLTTVMLSGGKHFLQEDIPDELGNAIHEWYVDL